MIDMQGYINSCSWQDIPRYGNAIEIQEVSRESCINGNVFIHSSIYPYFTYYSYI